MQSRKYFDDVLSSLIFIGFPTQPEPQKQEEKAGESKQQLRSQSGVFDPKLLNLFRTIDLSG